MIVSQEDILSAHEIRDVTKAALFERIKRPFILNQPLFLRMYTSVSANRVSQLPTGQGLHKDSR